MLFLQISFLIEDDKKWWNILGEIWADSESNSHQSEQWKELLLSKRSHREYFMDEGDRQAFNKLSSTLTIYRGHQYINKDGFSWTLNFKKALWFASRFNKAGTVDKKVVLKKDILAYLSKRNEEEIIYIPQ